MKHSDRLGTKLKGPNSNGWQDRHIEAIRHPTGAEQPIVHMLAAWLNYADSHRQRYNSGIGEDGVLGEEWSKIGAALRGLLNGETGRLDCGTLDGILCDALTEEGFNPDLI